MRRCSLPMAVFLRFACTRRMPLCSTTIQTAPTEQSSRRSTRGSRALSLVCFVPGACFAHCMLLCWSRSMWESWRVFSFGFGGGGREEPTLYRSTNTATDASADHGQWPNVYLSSLLHVSLCSSSSLLPPPPFCSSFVLVLLPHPPPLLLSPFCSTCP